MAKQYSVMIPNALAETTMVGRVTRDAESRFTPAGAKVANVSVAVGRRYNQDNEWKEQTAFYSAAIWGDAADRAAQVKKGDVISLTFHMSDVEARSYEKQDGSTGVSMQINRAQCSKLAWAGNGVSDAGDLPEAGAAVTSTEDEFPF